MKKFMILLMAFSFFSCYAQDDQALDDDMPQPYKGPQPGTPEFKEKFGDLAPPVPYTGPQPGSPDFDSSSMPPPPSIVTQDNSDSGEAEMEVAIDEGIDAPADKLAKLSEEEKKLLKKELESMTQLKMSLVKKVIDFRKKYGFVPENMKDVIARKKPVMKMKKLPLPPGLAPVSDDKQDEPVSRVEPPKPPPADEELSKENLPLMPSK